MNEAETRAELIDPALKAAGWGVVEGSRILREYRITEGRIEGRGRRGKADIADYVLVYRNTKLGVVEAKAEGEALTEGVGQAKQYAGKLAIRYTYASNGHGIYAIDMQTGKEGEIAAYPTPEEIWALTFAAFPEDALVRIAPDEIRKKGRAPKNGSLFFTIFQTFMTAGADEGGEGDLLNEIKPAVSSPLVYPLEQDDLTSLQMVAEARGVYGTYPPDLFDFIVIDECHRGGANDKSNWRDILDYFAPAVQLGLTATPKRKDNVDTYAYFGEPVFIYSLKEGINDGFLTPFRVKQIATTIDDYVWTSDDAVVEGEIEAGKRYGGFK
ncbi:MAG: DEAD/DEAH box helicase family protein [Verrucomicrobia bacterium]|nr:DEAD/DEAH box helicase family protein [Verrucomicrobiota bacterium]